MIRKRTLLIGNIMELENYFSEFFRETTTPPINSDDIFNYEIKDLPIKRQLSELPGKIGLVFYMSETTTSKEIKTAYVFNNG